MDPIERPGANDRWYPHVTVASLATRDGKYLLVQESYNGKSVLNQPAGHVEKGETLLQAVVRETLEETGWNFVPAFLCGIYQFVAANHETYIRFTYAGELASKCEGRALDPVIENVLWLDRAALENRSGQLRSPVVLKCISDFENGNRLPLQCVQQLNTKP
ncbi:MAG: NUDIX hydrolase [Gammaproteobacteria bacterium]|nr:NUDIX hydrolase [Gammaproteobacteria bacterium]